MKLEAYGGTIIASIGICIRDPYSTNMQYSVHDALIIYFYINWQCINKKKDLKVLEIS